VATQRELEELIELLHRETVTAYESTLERARAVRAEIAERAARQEMETRRVLSDGGVDLDRLDGLKDENAAALEELLQRETPHLAERPPDSTDVERLLYRDLLGRGLHWQTNSVFQSTLVGRKDQFLDATPGKGGNPWVRPHDPSRIRIRAHDSGSGWGCWAKPYVTGQDASVTFWFPFVPDITGLWYIAAFVSLHGYRILESNGAFLSCDNSSAKLEAVIDVYQYYWTGRKKYVLFDIDEGEIHDRKRIDEWRVFEDYVALAAGDWSVAMVEIDLYTDAKARGNYSEINFADGTANYIEPYVMGANYVQPHPGGHSPPNR
jgi:hypothetical protein